MQTITIEGIESEDCLLNLIDSFADRGFSMDVNKVKGVFIIKATKEESSWGPITTTYPIGDQMLFNFTGTAPDEEKFETINIYDSGTPFDLQ